MNTRHHVHVRLGLLAAATLLSLTLSSVRAEPLNVGVQANDATQPAAMLNAEPIPPPVPQAEAAAADAIDACHIFTPLVHYRSSWFCPPCCVAYEPVEVTLLVKDPASCDCYAEIPVCIPSCCVDEATICNRAGILGRRWVDYEWQCGFKISVLFRARGDVVVHYIF
jgi:hypothetical protein